MDPQAHLEDVEAWRSGRLNRLTGPDGWLAVVGLAWLREGPNTVGSDAASDVVLPPSAPARIGVIELEADRATFVPENGARVRHRHKTVTDRLELVDDHEGPPTRLFVESVSFFLIRREERLGVRIKDSDAPARSAFSGIDHYPVSVDWRLEARFEPYDPAGSVEVPTVLDTVETYGVPGALAFDIAGTTYRLDAFLEHGSTDLFVVFGDLTNRDETFGGGRYLYTKPADDRGIVVLDFNRAYNPPCVFTAHATCPLPLPKNRLPVRIEAGEMRYSSSSKPGAEAVGAG
jgi:uncharacterized protein (DUF1684 family)